MVCTFSCRFSWKNPCLLSQDDAYAPWGDLPVRQGARTLPHCNFQKRPFQRSSFSLACLFGKSKTFILSCIFFIRKPSKARGLFRLFRFFRTNSVALPPRKAENNPEFPTFRTPIPEIRNGGMCEINAGTSELGISQCWIPESVFQMSEIPESVCRKVGISGIGYVRFRKFLLLV